MTDQKADFGHAPLRNLRTESHVELKQANLVYNECFTKSFMPRWLKGE